MGSWQTAPFILHKVTELCESYICFNRKEPKKLWLSNSVQDENRGERSLPSIPQFASAGSSLWNQPGAPQTRRELRPSPTGHLQLWPPSLPSAPSHTRSPAALCHYWRDSSWFFCFPKCSHLPFFLSKNNGLIYGKFTLFSLTLVNITPVLWAALPSH